MNDPRTQRIRDVFAAGKSGHTVAARALELKAHRRARQAIESGEACSQAPPGHASMLTP